jgi:hypothetical protein
LLQKWRLNIKRPRVFHYFLICWRAAAPINQASHKRATLNTLTTKKQATFLCVS